jgi:octaprenyl-diphosphate synthase
VDVSSLRRGRPTANAEFGNASSVLVGDFLYTRAFQLMVELGDMEIMREMAATTNTIAAGEVLQLVRAGDPATTEAQYLDIITRKTAILFAAACYGAGVLAGANPAQCAALRSFGLNTGIAFQIFDDVLDYTGDASLMGKNVGDDLGEGKPTLPLIQVMREGNPQQKNLIEQAIRSRDASVIDAVVAAVQSCGALDYTRVSASRYAEQANADLMTLPDNEFRRAMQEVAELSINRDH